MTTMETLINAIKEQNPSAEVTEQDSAATLESVGLDSLDIATVIMEVENALDVKVSEEDITGETTLGEFCALLAA